MVCKSDLLEKWHLAKPNLSGSRWRICYGTATYLIRPQEIFFSEDEEASREVGGAGEEEKGSEVAIL